MTDDKKDEIVEGEGSITTEDPRAVAEIKAAIILAKRFPRDIVACRRKLLGECQRWEFADAAFYTLPYGCLLYTSPSPRD